MAQQTVSVGDVFEDNDIGRDYEVVAIDGDVTYRVRRFEVVKIEGDRARVRNLHNGKETSVSVDRLLNDRSARGYTPVES